MTEAYCDCTGSPPWPAMMRLHGGAPNHYYLCLECGAVREDVYEGGRLDAVSRSSSTAGTKSRTGCCPLRPVRKRWRS